MLDLQEDLNDTEILAGRFWLKHFYEKLICILLPQSEGSALVRATDIHWTNVENNLKIVEKINRLGLLVYYPYKVRNVGKISSNINCKPL
jgi:hypothetical protein